MQNESNIQELKISCEPIKKSIELCQNQILEAGGTRFKAQRSKVNDLKDQIKLQEKRSSKLVSVTVSLKKQNSETSNFDFGTEISNLERELKEIEELIEKLTFEAAFKVKKEQEILLKESEEFKENISELKKKSEILTRESKKLLKKENELKENIEGIFKEIEELKLKIFNYEKLIEKLNLNSEEMPKEIKNNNSKIVEETIKTLEMELSEMRPNLKVIEEYREKEKIYKKQREELEEIEMKRDENRLNYENLRKLRFEEFMKGFRQISLRLKELYQLITMGGNAELELVDSLDPFTEGILFSVMPPKKSWKNISNLSGGEKTLSSLALVFALHTFKPTPIYVMDEIDAALDFRNVSIVANYLKERTKDAQFIVISLRNNMFELADRLVGIYKTNQRTKSVTIDPKTFCIKSQ